MAKRTLIALPAVALLVSVVYFLGLYARIVVAAAGALCIYEMTDVTGKDATLFIKGIVYAFAVLAYPALAFFSFAGIAGLYALCTMAAFIGIVLTETDVRPSFLSALAMLYPGVFVVFLIAIICIPDPNGARLMMIVAFTSAVVTDTFAYLCGRFFGKHKLAERISPKKTIEGAVGGAVFGTAAVFIIGLFVQQAFGFHISPLWYLPLGFVLSVLTQFGDLAASIVKRKFGVKDYGKIMGEHGGAMDRLDSVLFICPVVFAFYLLIAI